MPGTSGPVHAIPLANLVVIDELYLPVPSKDETMFSLKHVALSATGTALILAIVPGGLAAARGEQELAKSARGGLLAKTNHYQFEVFFYPSGVRVFPTTPAGAPIDVSKVTATATFFHPNSPTPWFSRPLRLREVAQNEPSLDLPIGLSNAPASGAKVTFEVTGLPHTSEPSTAFTVPLEFVAAPGVTQAGPPESGVPTVPRYSYGPGYYGYGYYPYTSPGPALPETGTFTTYGSTMRFSGAGHEVGPNHRDWSTGRENPLAKPWMRPMD